MTIEELRVLQDMATELSRLRKSVKHWSDPTLTLSELIGRERDREHEWKECQRDEQFVSIIDAADAASFRAKTLARLEERLVATERQFSSQQIVSCG